MDELIEAGDANGDPVGAIRPSAVRRLPLPRRRIAWTADLFLEVEDLGRPPAFRICDRIEMSASLEVAALPVLGNGGLLSPVPRHGPAPLRVELAHLAERVFPGVCRAIPVEERQDGPDFSFVQ